MTPLTSKRVSLWRRLAAALYDSLLLFGVLFVATAVLLPFTGGEAIAPSNYLYSAYLLGAAFFFYGWFWTHGGQTLGMQAWKIRVVQFDGAALSWPRALLRFVAALLSWVLLGLGFLWSLVDRERLTWHDRLSKSTLIKVPTK